MIHPDRPLDISPRDYAESLFFPLVPFPTLLGLSDDPLRAFSYLFPGDRVLTIPFICRRSIDESGRLYEKVGTPRDEVSKLVVRRCEDDRWNNL